MPLNDTKRSGFQLRAAAKDAVDLILYDVIGEGFYGGIGAKAIAEALKEHRNATTINVFLNSPGGDVFDALAIYNTLVRHKARVVVNIDGAALSSASIVAMAGDEIRMAENALIMIHDPWAIFAGTAEEFRAEADRMDKGKETLVATYAARSGRDADAISAEMTAETWFTATEAVEAGFADEIVEAKRLAAFAGLGPAALKFKNAPEALKTFLGVESAAPPTQETTRMDEKDLEKATAQARAEAAAESRKLLADLKAAFPDAPTFAMAAFENGQSVVEAKAAYCDVVLAAKAELEAGLTKEIAELKAAAENAKPAAGKGIGVEPLGGATGEAGTGTGDAESEWNALVEKKIAAGMPRQKAVLAANRERPDLRLRYVDEHNAQHRRTG
jgi:ATP-dependent Clp endopeptidase proteolytic subunit ClpP